MNRTIYISTASYLHCKNSQLKIIDPITKLEKGSIPIEDVAFLVLDHVQITITHHVIIKLQEAKATLISCNAQHLPASIQIPLAAHSEHTERILQQTQISEPLKKQLWKQTVEEKINNQAALLKQLNLDFKPLQVYTNNVKTGDNTNREGVAAKYYWQQLFNNFTRGRHNSGPNNLLNFGYAILRSIVARALSTSGFHLALGIHHKSKYNATCLADDIMEPYRPFVDALVLQYLENNPSNDLNKQAKVHLLSLMQQDVFIDGKTRPLQVAVNNTVASFRKCINGENKYIRYPELK